MRQHSRRAANRIVSATAVGPTPERLTHGPIERLEQPISDALGAIGRPHRAIDILATMERRGAITASMRQAGEAFRNRFATAQLDPLRAFDWSRLRQGGNTRSTSGEEPGLRIERARELVWQALLGVGGLASPGGSCLWHVVGWQRSLKEWAIEQGWSGHRVSQEAASGILIAALGALEVHCHNGNSTRNNYFAIDKSGSI